MFFPIFTPYKNFYTKFINLPKPDISRIFEISSLTLVIEYAISFFLRVLQKDKINCIPAESISTTSIPHLN